MNTERRRIGSPSVFLVNGDYLQLCIYDCEHEVYKHSISQPDLTLDTDIIEALQEELHACNPHVRMFKGIDIDGEKSGHSHCTVRSNWQVIWLENSAEYVA